MENNEIKMLIQTFKEYRDLIGPIEQSLKSFSISFENISDDLKNLNTNFDGDIQGKLDKIYKELSGQAEKAKTLTSEVDRFTAMTGKYVNGVDGLVRLCEKIEEKMNTLNSIQDKAESQIEKLNLIIEEKRKTYDIKQLEKKLEIYNTGVQKVSEYINKDVADALKISSDTINMISDKQKSMFEAITKENESVDNLVKTYEASTNLLKKVVESNDVNEEYIFDILDKWAAMRSIKTKAPAKKKRKKK